MIVRAVCHTETSTLPGRESWQPRGFLAENYPDKVLIYLIYLATLSTLPTSLRWQPRSPTGSLDRVGHRYQVRQDLDDEIGLPHLLWLARGRLVVGLTAKEAIIRCPSGATLKFYRPAEIVTVAPATAISDVTQIVDDAPETTEIVKRTA